MRYLISGMIIALLGLFTMGCNGVKHVLQIEEPTDHTRLALDSARQVAALNPTIHL